SSIGVERIEAGVAKSGRDPDQREADQSGRVGTPDGGKEYDAEPFGLEAARAVIRLLEREVAVEGVAVEPREVDLGHVDGLPRAAVPAVDHGGGGVENDGAAAARFELLEGRLMATRLAEDSA